LEWREKSQSQILVLISVYSLIRITAAARFPQCTEADLHPQLLL